MAGITANEYESLDTLEPSKDGVEVYLKDYPRYEGPTDKAGPSIVFSYVGKEDKDKVVNFRIFDIFNLKPDLKENVKRANIQRCFALLTALMPKASQEEFGKISHTSMEGLLSTARKFFDPNVLDLPLKIMFGYNGKYKELKLFGNCISSPHKERSLVWDPNQSLKPQNTGRGKAAEEQADEEDDV